MHTHPWTKVETAPHQCWVCGQIETNLPNDRFHFIMVWAMAEDGSESRSITVHAGLCWRVLEPIVSALAPKVALLSANADGPPLPLME